MTYRIFIIAALAAALMFGCTKTEVEGERHVPTFYTFVHRWQVRMGGMA